MKKPLMLPVVLLLLLYLTACGAVLKAPAQKPLPPAAPDASSQFGVDKNINMATIDSWLGRTDVVYRDMRLLFDTADFAAIGGQADLARTIQGFKVVPYPYLATLPVLPVSGAYSGDRLFDVIWGQDGTIASAKPNFTESSMILQELFPKDKAVFLMCGGGGYAGMMRSLLIYLGWDASKLYNVGGNWSYKGSHALELVVYPENAKDSVIDATWRADYAYIDFSHLHKVSS